MTRDSGDLERYEAEGFCENCQYVGPVHPVVGQKVHTETCPVCRAAKLMPSHAPAALQARRRSDEERWT